MNERADTRENTRTDTRTDTRKGTRENTLAAHTLLLCCGTGCLASQAKAVGDALETAIMATGTNAKVEVGIKRTGCNGFCENGPIVKVHPDDISYYRVRPQHAEKIIASLDGEPVAALLYRGNDKKAVTKQRDNPFYAPQHKIALRNIGEIDPLDVEDYQARGGYQALEKALGMTSEQIIQEVIDSGLRGRGGAGFPTGIKWKTAAGYDEWPKYVVCNGDEGDPGAFMDRSILEGDPHSIIEGLVIAALAVGAEQGFLYIRDEYGLAQHNVGAAIASAEVGGILGDSILGSGHRLRLEIIRGGGAFVCGESTALMASIEGRVGEPRAKYIRSVQRGLWDQPTVLNNVETLANIPYILLHGGKKYAELGTEGSRGTKVFSLVGKVKRTGLVEVPTGVTLRHLIFDIGGGIKRNRTFKAVQTGGPSGGCIPSTLLDLGIDFDSLAEKGAMMGSGGMIVMDEHDCMVEVARYYVNFLAEESCGKCAPCREGLRHMLRVLTDITEGRGQEGDVEFLERLCATLMDASLCALGKTAPNPVLSTINHFRDEYDAHIRDKTCPAGVCVALTAFEIDAQACTGCGACNRVCPANALSGENKEARAISQKDCISCGSCREVCQFNAVYTRGRETAP